MRYKWVLFFSVFLISSGALADPDREDFLRKAITDVFPDVEITRIKPSPIPGLYEVMLGTEMIYLSEDGRYILQGDLIDLGEKINLSEREREAARKRVLESIPASETIDFVPDAAQHTVYVFTDITCGYCQLFHRDMAELNGRGVAVRYLAFPRAGVDSESFRDMESVWCAADPNEAMTLAKGGRPVKPAQCDNPVRRQYELGQTLGVRGTPAIYLENGREMPGYVPPDDLLQALNDYSG
ncbi:MAG: DsbC family protein [Gammaproteobacteria bacterium]|nr:DsbC family protein [Gammaproteobacteria bacterium]MDE0510547.1 DsbC family protein [Gammaproteobacteria bacterium]